MGRPVFEVTGYAIGADTYCLACSRRHFDLDTEPECHAVYLGSETDGEASCGICHREIETTVLNDTY
jgi:protein-disulfide isomerase-like protein with CxxC motif